MQKQKPQNRLEKSLKEQRFMPKELERKLIEIIKEPEKLEKYKNDLFLEWKSFLNFYQKLLEEDERESQFGTSRGYILLGVLAEGLVKIVLFFDDPSKYLDKKQGNRTLGNLKGEIKKLLKAHKKESNETKIKNLEKSLELINSLRNNFIHFPFYYSDDYRFRGIFFQVFAYLLDKFSLWEYLDSPEVEFIKERAKKPGGVSLFDVELYEQ